MSTVSTFGTYTVARLGIYASQKALTVTGNNIANVNTEGYTRQVVDQRSLQTGYGDKYVSKLDTRVGGGTLVTSVEQERDQYLDVRYRSEQSNVEAMKQKLSGLNQIASILDEVGRGKDGEGVLEARFNEMISQLERLATQGAGRDSLDTLFRSAVQSFTNQLNKTASDLDELEKNLSKGLDQTIDDVNGILSDIRDLNSQIRKSQIYGGDALTLRDERNMLIDELSRQIRINVAYDTENLGEGVEVERLVITTADSPERTLVNGVYATQISSHIDEDTGVYGLSLSKLVDSKGRTIDASTISAGYYKGNVEGTWQQEELIETSDGEVEKDTETGNVLSPGYEIVKDSETGNDLIYNNQYTAKNVMSDLYDAIPSGRFVTVPSDSEDTPRYFVDSDNQLAWYSVEPYGDGTDVDPELRGKYRIQKNYAKTYDSNDKSGGGGYDQATAALGDKNDASKGGAYGSLDNDQLVDPAGDSGLFYYPSKDKAQYVCEYALSELYSDANTGENVTALVRNTLYYADQSRAEAIARQRNAELGSDSGSYEWRVDKIDSDTIDELEGDYYQVVKYSANGFETQDEAEAQTQILQSELAAGAHPEVTNPVTGEKITVDSYEAVYDSNDHVWKVEMWGSFYGETDVGDAELYGGVQAQKDILNKQGVYATLGELLQDPDAAIKRGIGYYRQCLDVLANQFAYVLNEANTIDGEEGRVLISSDGNSDTREGITAANITVSASWANGSMRVLTSVNKDDLSTDNENLKHILNILTSDYQFRPMMNDMEEFYKSSNQMPASNQVFFTGSFQELLTDHIQGTLATDIKVTEVMLESYSDQADELYVEREAVSGVDLNDEAISMMMYQKSYSAACRLMTIYDELLDKLINGTGA